MIDSSPRSSVAPFVLFLLAVFAPTAMANPVAIQDASFDNRSLNSGSSSTTLTPWQETGGVGNSGGYIQRITGFAGNGQNHLGMNLNHNVWQDLGVTYQANTRYTLTVAVGNRSTILTTANNQSRYLLAASDGTIFATGTFNASTIPVGTFADAPPLVLETGTRSAGIGKPVRILLEARGSGRLHFDNIRLTAVPKQAQTITFAEFEPVAVGDPPVALTATASSGLPVALSSSDSSIASVSGSTLTIHAAGTVTITAHQSGNQDFLHATVQRSLLVYPEGKVFQTIAFEKPVDPVHGSSPVPLTASATSGLPVSYFSSDTALAVIEGGMLVARQPGTVVITATQAGNAGFLAAEPVSHSIKVLPGLLVVPGELPYTVARGAGEFTVEIPITATAGGFIHWWAGLESHTTWLGITGSGGSTPGALAFRIDPGNLLPGEHDASVLVFADTSVFRIQVRLSVTSDQPLEHFDLLTPDHAPLSADRFTADGRLASFRLHFAPQVGSRIKVLDVAGRARIEGTFANTPDGQRIDLDYQGVSYPFVANYYGGDGNDLVLEWAYKRIHAWGLNLGAYGSGQNSFNSIPKPVDPAGFFADKSATAIAGGEDFTLMLFVDGTLAATGVNNGRLGNDSTLGSSSPVDITNSGVLAGKRVVAICAGQDHSLALCSDGSVAAWGYNTSGQLGDGTTSLSRVPIAVTGGALAGKSAIAVAAGNTHSMALCADGTIVAWGHNSNGQLGNGSTTSSLVPVEVDSSGALAGKMATAIAARSGYSMALCSDGTVVNWGSGWVGGLGNGETLNSSVPVAVSTTGVLAGRTVTAIESGDNASIALCSDGSVAGWGYNGMSSLGDGTSTNTAVPVLAKTDGVLFGKTPIRISATTSTYALCSDGTLAAWGSNHSYQFGNGSLAFSNVPVATSLESLATGEKFIDLMRGNQARHMMAISALPLSSEARLASLVTEGGELDQPFEPERTDYQILVSAQTSAFTLTPGTSDPSASLRLEGALIPSGSPVGPLPATLGRTFTLEVVAENGVDRTLYRITVAADTTLASLGLSQGSLLPAFSPFARDYSVSVGTATATLVVTPVAADPTATVTINGTPATGQGVTLPLVYGSNPVAVTVTALDGTVITYQMNVTRAAAVDFTYTSATAVPLSVPAYVATDNTVALALGFAPAAGTDLTVVENTGSDPITGRFANLAHGQSLSLMYNGATYRFVANYLGGDGNDLVLQWATETLYGWGRNSQGQVGDGLTFNHTRPVPLAASSALAGKTIISLAAGQSHSVALCADGTLAAWGSNSVGQLGTGDTVGRSIPVEITGAGVLAGRRVVAIAAGGAHTLALCEDGTLAAWGGNSDGRLGTGQIYPSNLPVAVASSGVLSGKTVTAIAAGASHSMALCSDGTVVAWGSGLFGRLGNGSTGNSIVPMAVDSTGALLGKTVTAIAAGSDHSIARCSDGTLVAWGYNNEYQLGDTTTIDRLVPVAIPHTGVLAGKHVSKIAAGGRHNLALCSDGTVVAWGSNSLSQLGNGAYSTVPVRVSTSGVLAGRKVTGISAGGDFGLALCSDGTLAMWGYDFSFSGGTPYNSTPVPVNLSVMGVGEKVVGISQGSTAQHVHFVSALPVSGDSSLAGLELGTGALTQAFSAGTTSYSARVPHGTASITLTPTAANAYATIEVNGSPLASGTTSAPIALSPGNMTLTVKVTAQKGTSTTYTLTVQDDATLSDLVLSAGSLVSGFEPGTFSYTAYVPTATAELVVTPTVTDAVASITLNGAPVLSGSPSTPVGLAMGSNTITLWVTALDGTVGTYSIHAIRQVPVSYTFTSPSATGVTASAYTAAGNTANLSLGFAPAAGTSLRVVNNTGMLPITGMFDNLDHGQRIDLSYNGVSYPFVANYFGGSGNDLVLQWANARLLSWGNNSRYQLGDGTTNASNVPVAMPMTGALEGRTILSVVAGHEHNLAVCSDGRVAAWGNNRDGQLGNNSSADSSVPVLVDATTALADKSVIMVAASRDHSLALCSDGTIAAWGVNISGQLGNGSTTSSPVPVAVSRSGVLAGRTVVAIAAGDSFSLALCADGTLATWGSNVDGKLGVGVASGNSSVPVQVDRSGVLAGKTVVAIAARYTHCLALCADGDVASWGNNNHNQLGNYSLPDIGKPVLVDRSGVLAGKTIISVSAGDSFSLALCSDSSVAGWGNGGSGQLGTGGYEYQRRLPVLANQTGVLAGKTITSIDTGHGHVLALCSDGNLAAWGQNSSGPLGIGSTSQSLAPALVNLGLLGSGQRLVAAKGGGSHSLAVVAMPPQPSATTLAASNVVETSATLVGMVNAAGTASEVFFEYGTSPGYGTTVTATPATVGGTAATAVSAAISGLVPGTTYHYRVVASNANGISLGADSTFTTTNLAALSSLTLSEGALYPAFDDRKLRYFTTVPFAVDSVTVTPVCALPTSNVTVNGVATVSAAASQPIAMPVGDSTIDIVVTNPDGTKTRTYTVTVTRLPEAFVFNLSTDVPVTVSDFAAAGMVPELLLNHTPVVGSSLTVIRNTGVNPIRGTFANLAQGQPVALTYAGVTYSYVADYFGGSGNDLVLQWANTRLLAWGTNHYGELGNKTTTGSSIPVPVDMTGVLAGKTVVSVSTGGVHSLALCADGTLAAWGYNQDGGIGNGSTINSSVPVLVDRTGLLAGKAIIAISAGISHSLALCSDGTLAAWGSNGRGALGNNSTINSSVPVAVDLTGVLAGKTIVSIGAGNTHNLVLCADGTLVTWGWGNFGQLGNNTTTDSPAPVLVDRTGVLAGKTVVAVSAGSGHNLALCSDGTVAAWGNNSHGQLGNNSQTNAIVPVLVNQSGVLAGKSAVAIRAGQAFSLALCSDGTMASWGFNNSGRLGNHSTTSSSVPVLVTQTGVLSGKTVIANAVGITSSHSLALCADGTLASWGHNFGGQLGNNSTTNSNVPVLVEASGLRTGERFTAAAAGYSNSVALAASPPPAVASTVAAAAIIDTGATLNGSVSANGNSATVAFEYGLTDTYGMTIAATPAAVAGTTPTAVSTIVSGLLPGTTYHYRVVATNEYGTVKGEDMTFTTTTLATLADLALDNASLAPAFAGTTTSYFATVPFATADVTLSPVVTTPGAVVTVAGIAVESGSASAPIPLKVGANPITVKVTSADGKITMTYTVTVTRLPQAFIFNSPADVPLTLNDFAATGPAPELVLNFAPEPGTRLTVVNNTGRNLIQGAFSNLAQGQAVNLTYDGVDYSFSVNYFGGSGNDLVLEWAITRLIGWGNNTNGQLGNGTTNASTTPVQVDQSGVLASKTVVSMAYLSTHGMVLCTDGTLAAWGSNPDGRLGNGTTTDSTVPTLVERTGVLAGKTVIQIAAGATHSFALCDDGTIAAWGENSHGQLGNGTTTNSAVPVLTDLAGVLAGKRVVSVAASYRFSLALCADGTMAAWGNGYLGNGTFGSANVPVLVDQTGVLAGKRVVSVAVSYRFGLALCDDGTLAAWGENSFGNLGDGSTTTTSTRPLLVSRSGVLAGKNVISIVAGYYHCLALCSDGTAVAWGRNNSGQLGDNSTTNRSAPVAVFQNGVLAGKKVVAIGAGESHSLFLCADGTLAACGNNQSARLGDGTLNNRMVPVLSSAVTLGAGEQILGIAAAVASSHLLVASPRPPVATTLAASALSDTGASLHGSVNAQDSDTAVSFDYGPTTAFGRTVAATPATVTGNGDSAVSATLQGLLPGRVYHFRVVATSPGGTVKGEDQTFTTTTFAALAGLTTSAGDLAPAFDAAVSVYGMTVPASVASLTVTPTAAHPETTVRINGTVIESGTASAPLDLSVGDNRIEVECTAAGGGNILTYVLNVARLPEAFEFASDSAVPLVVDGLAASGEAPPFELNFAPTPGTRLTVVNNAGSEPIRGEFDNLAQGQLVQLTHNGIRYPFVASYYGGTGNDLVLQWANTRMMTWGFNGSGALGDGGSSNSMVPVPVVTEGVLAGKTVVHVAAGFASASALCADGTVAAWGFNGNGTLGDGTGVSKSVPVLVDQSGVLAGKTVIAISSGRAHMLALCSDGTLAAWGLNTSGQLGDGSTTDRNAPVLVDQSGVLAGKTVTSIAAGFDFSLVLCSDGTLAAWGTNSSGHLGDGSTTNRSVPVAVDQTGVLGGRQVIAISAGVSHCLALCSDGTLVAWGSNSHGAFGNGSTISSSIPVAVEPSGALAGRTITGITAGDSYSLALCTDGTLAAWGFNNDGRLGNGSSGSNANSSIPVAVDRTGVLSGQTLIGLATGSRGTSLALCADGTIAAWGTNNFGQFGNGSNSASNVPVPAGVGGLRNGERYMAVAPGHNATNSLVAMPPPPAATTLAATDVSDHRATFNGSVNAQGGDAMVWFEYGPTPSYGKTAAAVPAMVSGEIMTAVSANIDGLLAGITYHFRVVASGPGGVTQGEDLTFTTSDRAALADLALSVGTLSPAFTSPVTGYTATVAHSVTSVTLTPQATHATATLTINGAPHPSGTTTAPLALVTGENTITVAVDAEDGLNTATYTVKVVRLPEMFIFDSPGDVPLSVSGLAPGGLPVSVALSHPPAPGTTLTLVENTGPDPIRGEFAGITEGQRVLLTYDGIIYDFIASYSGGTGNDLVLRWANIRLLGWGSATNGGALGGKVPTRLANEGALAGKSIAAISTGGSHGVARCLDGTVVTWGDNSSGQLGTGSTGGGAVPVEVDRTGVLAGKVVVAVATGGSHDLALCSDGTLVAWGSNQSGQLGAGFFSTRSFSPVQVDQSGVLAGKTPVAIAAGGSHSLVLCVDGTLVAWGAAGTLGNGSSTASNVPVLVDRSGVLAGKIPVAIAAGSSHSLVLCADGTVAAWGPGNHGQLGNGATASSPTPVLVDASGILAGKKVIAIAAGTSHNLALCADGTLVAWGRNNDGQLGDFSNTGRTTPVAVNALGPLAGRRVIEIAAGGAHSLALCDDGTLLAWGDNGYNQLGTDVNLDSSVPTPVAAGAILPGDQAIAISAAFYYSAALVASPPSPVVQTLAADQILDTGATLRASVNANSTDVTISFEYGLTTAYGTTVTASPALVSGFSPTAASALINGLDPGQTYHYRVVTTRPDLVTRGEDRTFTTTTLSALADLQLSHGTLSPAFSMIDREYIATVPDTAASLTVTPLAATSGATIRVAGAAVASAAASDPIPLALGENRVEIGVTSPDGLQSRTYAVTVTRLPASFVFDSPSDVPLTVRDLVADGNFIEFTLNHAPVPGARLMAVRNTGNNPIQGRFLNLGQGQLVYLVHNGTSYPYVADYHGGTGNDLVLHWANNRLVAFGNNQSGKLGDGSLASRSVPVPVTDTGVLDGKIVTDIQSGAGHTVALCSDGTVATWGDNSSGQLGRPGGASSVPVAVDQTGVLADKRVVAIASGGYHVFALCEDGSLVGWGGNGSGNLGPIGVTTTSVPVLIPMTGALAGRRVIAIAAGQVHTVALCSDGTLAGWGYSGDGQTGTGSNTWVGNPALVDRSGVLAGKTVTELAAGQFYSLALCSDGTVAAWGKNDYGQLGNGSGSSLVPVSVDQTGVLAGKSVISIDCGSATSMALCSDGTLAMWGNGSSGSLGNGGTSHALVPAAVDQTGVLAGKMVAGISAGGGHALAWNAYGTLAVWGNNSSGQLGDDSNISRTVPVPISTAFMQDGERFIAASCGDTHAIALVASPPPPPPRVDVMAATEITGTSVVLNGGVNAMKNFLTLSFDYGEDISYGSNVAATPATLAGKLDTAVTGVLTELKPGTTYHYRMVAASHGWTVASEDMTFTTLSDNARLATLDMSGGILGPDFEKEIGRYFVSVPHAIDSTALTAVTDHPAATFQVNGAPVDSGSASQPSALPPGSTTITIHVTAEDRITTKTYTVTVTRLPETFAFELPGDVPLTVDGFSPRGTVANLELNFAPRPGTILTVVNNTALDFIHGRFANLAQGQRLWLSHDGVWYAFVANYYGGTGNDLVLQWAGTRVAAWGLNNYGQLGDGGNTQRLSPIAIDDSGVLADKTIFAISTGYLHSVALSSDGTLASWGYNVQGQLGNNAIANSSVPVAIDTSGVLSDKVVVAIASGSYHNLALCSDGTVAAWGFNNHGQLGDGTKTTARTPVLVNAEGALAGKQVVAIAAGAYQSYALCSDGTIAAWGYNDEGELGNGANTGSLVPVTVDVNGALAGRKVAAIAAGQYHTLALCTDGTVVSWGYNQRGQLGNSSTADSASPVEIGSFGVLAGRSVKAIAAGASHSLALCTDGTLATWGFNSQSQLGATGINQSTTPVAVAQANRPLVALAAGANHNLLHSTDGSMTTWGGNSNGQLGSNNTQASAAPVNVDTSALDHGGFIMFAASGCASSHNLAVFAVPVDAPVGLVAPSGLEAWRLDHFADIGVGNPLAADNADFDGDGIPNLLEYAFGLDPRAHCNGVLPAPNRIGDRLEVRFSRAQLAPDIEYGAEWSPDLQPGSWRDVPDSGNGGEHVFSMPLDTAPSMFMRLRVRSNISQ